MNEDCEAVLVLGGFDVPCELPTGHYGRHHADEYTNDVSATIDWSER